MGLTFLYTINMTNLLRNQKDSLAKLMASENLSIQHKKVSTASFDVKNRVLTCPIFKEDMSAELYDLFMGHEVSHALHTPYEGLHSTLIDNRVLKDYLNVIEDIRIEKMIKNKFPGLRKSFFKAYDELMKRDFFGISGKNLEDLSAIDRINLYSKVGVTSGVTLNEIEQDFYDRSFNAKTFEEVVEIAQELYDWSAENEKGDEEEVVSVTDLTDFDFEEDEDGEYENTGSSTGGDGDEVEEESESDNPSTGNGESTEETSEDTLPDVSDMGNEQQTPLFEDADGGTEGGKAKPQARKSITERNAHNNEQNFQVDNDDWRVKERIYANMDVKTDEKLQYFLKNAVVTVDEMEENIQYSLNENLKNKEDKTEADSYWNFANHSFKKLEAKNKKIVNHMAKEFEMKKSAYLSKRAMSSKTGRIDLTKLSKYQISEDIFKRMTYLPQGKNHGLVVFIDHSGSIADTLCDLLEQAFILMMFCKKVNIPFKILSFSDVYGDDNVEPNEYAYRTDAIRLLEWFSSDMSKSQFLKAGKVFGAIFNAKKAGDAYGWLTEKKYNELVDWFEIDHDGFEFYDQYGSDLGLKNLDWWTPRRLGLGGTPLDASIVWARYTLPKLQKAWGVDLMNATFITDGYSHQYDHFDWGEGGRYGNDRYITDKVSKKTYKYDCSDNGFMRTCNLIEWMKSETSVNVNGYFILGKKQEYNNLKGCISDGYFSYSQSDREWKEIKKQGSVIPCHGYGKLFVAQSKVLEVAGDDELSDELVGESRAKLTTAFKRNQMNKSTSRYLMNQFIQEIA